MIWTSAATKIWANMVADQPIVRGEVPASTSPSDSATDSPTGSATAPATTPTTDTDTDPAGQLPPRRPVQRGSHPRRLRLMP